ncbi:YheC/YheD family protein [Oceanobacillus halotolerans]|uniref:YheC/YheD family protein n=1 Tax=Oceanobacillus halotolerans TaxID=2663380 RepID=UPI0013DA35CC|nr:YheC/YheD family protein [Oceanobacillus halotolerans]
MQSSSDKQLQQVRNIVQTLIEATEHFHKLIKEKELNQSIFIFSSIVEGFGAVNNISYTGSNHDEWNTNKNKVEKYLLDIAKLLEKGNFIKISEILQFSLLPLLKKMEQGIADEIGDQHKEKIYTIGVFHSFRNPREFYMESRVNALVQEGEKQNTRVHFFTSEDVDFDNKTVTADEYKNGEWRRVTTSFPDVINNAGAGKRSHVERKLRRIIPFTSFFVGNKYTLPKKMVKHRKFAELLVPFIRCRNEEDIHTFIDKNMKVVFKGIRSNRAENIYFVTKKGNHYILLEHKKERILNHETFQKWLKSIVLSDKGSFIVQRYINARTKDDEPFHIRSQVQKNGEGKWVVTHIYVTVGNKKGNISNLNAGGRREEIHTFLQQEYGEEKGNEYEHFFKELAIDVAMHLDKLYGFTLDELGLDLTIDDANRVWMHEANNGPVTRFFDDKRAVHTIAYAKYIAKNGIVHVDNNRKAENGLFQAQISNLELAELDNQPTIGMLTGKIVNDPLAVACAKAAKKQNIQLISFTPKDLDYDEMLIKGYFYEHDEWVPKIVEYPDIIFDRLKLRGDKNAHWIYEELEDIPFTNEWETKRYNRSEIYNRIHDIEAISTIQVPFRKVTKARDIFRSIEDYGKVLLKPENLNQGGYGIEIRSNRKYALTSGNTVKEYNELPLQNKIKNMINETNYIIQKDPRSSDKHDQTFSIYAHLMLWKEEWRFVSLYTQKTGNTAAKEDFVEFLHDNYSKENAILFKNRTEEVSKIIASELRKIYGDVISEVAVELAINEKQQLEVIDIDPNGPARIYDATKHAEAIMEYAEDVVSLNKNKELQI